MTRLPRQILSLLFAALCGGMAAAPGYAHDAPSSPDRSCSSGREEPPPRPWRSLDATQREMLAPLQKEWDTLTSYRQTRMLERAKHWATLPPEQREEIRQRIARWQQMTPQQRQQARDNRHKYHELSPAQRKQLDATYERFQHLPPEQRDRLMREWHELPVEQRLQWRDRSSRNGPPPATPPRRESRPDADKP